MVMLPGYGSVAFYQNFLFVELFYFCIFEEHTHAPTGRMFRDLNLK